jgi:hypothetical protein
MHRARTICWRAVVRCCVGVMGVEEEEEEEEEEEGGGAGSSSLLL